jgi:abequosyltransferase
MTDPIKLSICIPTYNFGAFIAQTLDSIIPQLLPEVELVILDGGSSDNTPEVVRAFLNRGLPISYMRQEVRGGIDRDMARTVELARGEYCWLFSSDDIMKSGAIRLVLDEIQSGYDIYLCGMTLCDFNMRPIREHNVSSLMQAANFELSDAGQRLDYFEHAETTTALFSFMGSVIIQRKRWNSVPLNELFVGSCWAHVARIFSLIPYGLRVRYLARPLLDKRMDNDSFMEKGIVHRFGIAINGYHRLASTYFGTRSLEALHIRRVVRNEFDRRALLNMKVAMLRSNDAKDLPQFNNLVFKLYDDPSFSNMLFRLAFSQPRYLLRILTYLVLFLSHPVHYTLRLCARTCERLPRPLYSIIRRMFRFLKYFPKSSE